MRTRTTLPPEWGPRFSRLAGLVRAPMRDAEKGFLMALTYIGLWRSQPPGHRGQTSGARADTPTGLCAWNSSGLHQGGRWLLGPTLPLVSLVSRGGQGLELGGRARRRHPFCPLASHLAWGHQPSSQLCLPLTLTLSLCERTQPRGGKCELKVCFSSLYSWPPPPQFHQSCGSWLVPGCSWGGGLWEGCGCQKPSAKSGSQEGRAREEAKFHAHLYLSHLEGGQGP